MRNNRLVTFLKKGPRLNICSSCYEIVSQHVLNRWRSIVTGYLFYDRRLLLVRMQVGNFSADSNK